MDEAVLTNHIVLDTIPLDTVPGPLQRNWQVLRQQERRSRKNIKPAARTDARDCKTL